MPAGDAGLERQPADAEYQAICGWVTKYGWLNAAMAERVRQLLHRQQAVVDAAREAAYVLREKPGGEWEALEQLETALNAMAVQPEGERAR